MSESRTAAPGPRACEKVSRPVIVVEGGGLSQQATEGERALLGLGTTIFQRGSALVRPVIEEVDAAGGRRTTVARLAPIRVPYMRDLLCRCATWCKLDQRRGTEVLIDPPTDVAQVILHRLGEWQFPQVVGVITTPTMRSDGSLLLTPGYDPGTRLILVDPPTNA